jgi:uncharacterized protein (UPF0276 family)
MNFFRRVQQLPCLGIGVSTEYGAARAEGALDVFALAERRPDDAAFLEIGVEVAKGFDDDARRWIASGRPTTYHFLDVNLDDAPGPGGDLDDAWLAGLRALVAEARPAWLCGDAGLWHFGVRDRAHMLLLPPILTAESARDIARGVAFLREATGHEVLPETPPGTAFVGDLHLLDFFARVAEAADTGLLLDVAHVAMYQHVTGRSPLDGLDGFPMERVVEVHVAGSAIRDVDGFSVIDDTHGTEVLPGTWAIFEAVCARATHLKAVVFECERNRTDTVGLGLDRIRDTWRRAGGAV